MKLEKPLPGRLPAPGALYVEEYQGMALAAIAKQAEEGLPDLSMPGLYKLAKLTKYWTEFNLACNALEAEGKIEAYFDPRGIYRMRLGKCADRASTNLLQYKSTEQQLAP